MASAAQKKIVELIKNSEMCMFTTMQKDGKHVSRPMAMQKIEFDGDLWFFTYDNTEKVEEFEHHPQVNIAFNNGKSTWVSISGKAKLVYNKEKMKELWSPEHKAWFPDGLETKHLALIKVKADSAEYWDTPGGPAVQLLEMAKAVVKKKEAHPGENKTLEF